MSDYSIELVQLSSYEISFKSLTFISLDPKFNILGKCQTFNDVLTLAESDLKQKETHLAPSFIGFLH